MHQPIGCIAHSHATDNNYPNHSPRTSRPQVAVVADLDPILTGVAVTVDVEPADELQRDNGANRRLNEPRTFCRYRISNILCIAGR